MAEQNTSESRFKDAPEAVVKVRKQFSIVWVVPLVALLIGGWLAFKAISEKGPTITITFKTAEGLEAGKTKIKYKDVEVGQVQSIDLTEGGSDVTVTAELRKSAEPHLTENTRFWVERARIGAGGASGLGTLFAGAYIGTDIGKPGGKPARSFKGLELPPVITTGLPGSHFTLRAEKLGSLDIGSPIYYRQIKVGQVVAYELGKTGKHVDIKIFIDAPHHGDIFENTRFWNASGLDVAVDASGIRINTQSFLTMMIGGIAYDTPANLEPGAPAQEGATFKLYASREKIFEKAYVERKPWLLYFDGSVRGLAVGAPVELQGIQIGEVTDITLEFDREKLAFRIPVLIELEPERIKFIGGERALSTAERKRGMDILVARGLRAQLKTGSLLTGQLLIGLDFHSEAAPAKINWDGRYPELPTIPTPMEEITSGVTRIVEKFDKIPLEQIGKDLQQTMANLSKTTANLQTLVQKLDANVAPAATDTLKQAQTTLIKVDRLLNADSPTGHELKRALAELADAARNISILMDYLERHPDSVIFGKEQSNEK
ncbi:MAG: MlaD family protein [Deltaproteobacteria bacterium]|nr:MlaD family protein [Deltaproteobacteria bacterium]MDH3802689.1 MlaD family protein [Deltaproteobacteria bacterium]MDH3898481.1 MlaD family protein [Deltaproteobacteria bacterium]